MSFSKGDRIVVISSPNKYAKYGICGEHGFIRGFYKDEITVKLDNIENSSSAGGVFYLSYRMLEKETEVKSESEVTIMDGNYRVVRVEFLDRPGVFFKCACYDETVKIDDVCMVKSKSHGFGIAKVTVFVEDNDEPLTREIVARIDMSAYNDRVAQRKRRSELKQKMEERAAKLQEIALYELLAKEDTEMADLLKAYKGA